MKNYWTKHVVKKTKPWMTLTGAISLALSSSIVTAESLARPTLLQACMPQFSAENVLSIPEDCSYTISSYLSSYLSTSTTPSTTTSNFQQRADATKLGNNTEPQNSCTIDNTVRNTLSLAITKKLVAAGESDYNIEKMINDSIAEEYPC